MTFDLHPWFARPALLACVMVVPLLGLLALLAHLARRRAVARLGSVLCTRRLALVRPRRRRWRNLLALAGLFLLAIACAGPQWGLDTHQWRAPVADLAIVLDLSRSMQAEQPSRRERALRALRDLTDHLQAHGGCRVALVAFASRARLVFPLTQDYDHFRHALTQIENDDFPPLVPGPDEPLVSGTRIGAALKLAVQALDGQRTGARAIVMLSDGDDPGDDREWLEGTQATRVAQLPVHIVGFGDPQAGHTIPIRGGVLHYAREVVYTRLDEDVLREIARRTGGVYLPARTDTIPLGTLARALLAQPGPDEETDAAGRPVPAQQYAWFLVPALALLMLSMLLADGPARRLARPRLVPLALAAVLLSLVGAASVEEMRDLVRQGNEAFARQHYEQALELYSQAEEESDDPGLVAFNKAAAYYRLGHFREAELHYRRCLEDDQVPGLRRARTSFDLGNSLVRQAGERDVAQLAQAVVAYRACLKDPAADADLRGDARYNLELAQLLWLKAKARADQKSESERQSRPDPEKRQPGQGNDKKPGGMDDDGKDPQAPDGGEAPGAKAPGKNKAATGPLQVLPDADELVPLSPEEAQAHLRRLAEQITRERRHHHQSRPATGSAKDW